MSIRVNINGREIVANDNMTIVEIAKANGIDIPTLCHDERIKTYASCGICLVEVENMPRLVRSCSTMAMDGMVIKTESTKISGARKTVLDLLLSDHVGDCRPPCLTACPGQTDCQGYVGLIANGEYEEALKLIKDKIPLPASIGRVCPHPCEDACRRQLVEEPIAIANLKAFAADMDRKSENEYMPEIGKETGKNIAVIGGGPGGLSAAYFLRKLGHSVTVYDKMGKMGGMLRYGIPEYRLPQTIVDSEVSSIERMNIKMVTGIEIGKDVMFAHIKDKYDATVVAIGAWTSSALRCKGEELEGVIGGIDFLRAVTLNETCLTGKKIAVVGGGNTAMDAARTAIRLGAAAVYNVYRRTKDEMPAEDIEILEAEEEGVIFKYLSNPIELTGNANGRVTKMKLQKMQLGEPDASGRRAPVEIVGATEDVDVDTVIVAIGQGVNLHGFEALEATKRNTISADELTFATNIDGVFAIGDATNKGASIAIEAIGEAKRAANVIDGYLKGETVPYKKPFIVTTVKTAADFEEKKKISREKMKHLTSNDRKTNFQEVNQGYTKEQAVAEAKRCLECGCADFFECKLLDYSNRYDVTPEIIKGEMHSRKPDVSNPFFYINSEKCILCGQCVRVCDEVMGRTALGLVDRGFDTVVKPSLFAPIVETDCISCGQCVTVCPTGAISEILPIPKGVPLEEKVTESICSFCSVGCKTKVTTKGTKLLRSLPNDNKNKTAILCAKGRFGLGELQKQKQVTKPLISKDGKLSEVSMTDALMFVTKKAQGLTALHGANALAVAISDKYTTEEIYLINKYAKDVLKTDNVYSLNGVKSGLKDVFGADLSTNTYEELASTEVIVLMCEDIINSHTIAGIAIKKAVEGGAKLILISGKETQADEWATMKIEPSNNLDTLKQFAKALIDGGSNPKNANGFDEFKKYVGETVATEEIKAAAELYGKAKKAMFVFENNAYSTDAARLVADIAVISGQIGKPRAGVMTLYPNNNTAGLISLGINTDAEQLVKMVDKKQIRGLLIFGEDVPFLNFDNVEFLMVNDYLMTETADRADVVLPSATPSETNGTYVSTTRHIQFVNQALPPLMGMENWEMISKLANVSEDVFNYDSPCAIRKEIGVVNADFRGLKRCKVENEIVRLPIGKSHVCFEDGFATDDKKANITIPTSNKVFRENENTHGGYNKFVNYLDNKKLLK